MSKFLKVLTASIVCVGFASTAQAGTSTPSNVYAPSATATLQVAGTKKVVRTVKRLPMTRKAATNSTRTVLFYKAAPTRSKIINTKPSKTSTPNHFKK